MLVAGPVDSTPDQHPLMSHDPTMCTTAKQSLIRLIDYLHPLAGIAYR